MAKSINISKILNTNINNLFILSEGEPHITSGGYKHRTIICKCECGKIFKTQISNVLNGSTKSCGCYSAKKASDRIKIINTTHGLSKTPEYNIWCSMKKRCLNPNNSHYKNYGGRGIKICDRWLNSYENFLEDMGTRPTINHSIDRRNNNDGYYPENCYWATKKEQCRNQRTNVLVTYNGETKCIAEWAEKYCISWQSLYYRLFISKMGIQKAFSI